VRTDRRTRIEIHGDLHHGEPRIRGTRVLVRTILGSLADGMSVAQIRGAYPQLSAEDVSAPLAYAAAVLENDLFVPPSSRSLPTRHCLRPVRKESAVRW